MKLANVNDRAVLVLGEETADVAEASDGRFGPDLMGIYDDWGAFLDFAGAVTTGTRRLVEAELRCPVPAPRQVFAVGLPASLAGPFDDVEIVGNSIDWEVELVAVLGRRADRVDEATAWAHIAGLTVGQDISDRELQFAAGAQFSLGKSRRGYGPMGPWLTTQDEVPDPDDIALGCSVDGEKVQEARTSDLVFSVPRLVAELSAVLPLLPGDVIFTGTPAGVGVARQPPRFLRSGQVLESWIEGIGTIRNHCV